jgi:hypothetical protein
MNVDAEGALVDCQGWKRLEKSAGQTKHGGRKMMVKITVIGRPNFWTNILCPSWMRKRG